MISVNKNALKIVKDMIERKEELKINVEEEGEATIIDCGITVNGSIEAGILVSRICTGDLSIISITRNKERPGTPLLKIKSNWPVISCLGSQYAGWKISINNFFALGSGPARALSDSEEELFTNIGYNDNSEVGVICLETRERIKPAVLDYIAEHCGILKENLYVLLMPTASIVGSIQISARVLETALHRALNLKYPISSIKAGSGNCPIPKTLGSDRLAMGLTNDTIIMMGEVHLEVDDIEDDNIKKYFSKAPSVYSSSFGEPFLKILERADYNFYKIDPSLFSPAKITIINRRTGSEFDFGHKNSELYERAVKYYLSLDDSK